MVLRLPRLGAHTACMRVDGKVQGFVILLGANAKGVPTKLTRILFPHRCEDGAPQLSKQ